ncbi:MAG: exodeoxyribonuclease VII small subunit [Anaerolineales bacterium]|jgi:exodeoxyribonuclease VII small subunit
MPPRKKRDDVTRLSYEKALEELKSIVHRLETETPPLEEAIGLFERGQLLAKHCADLLGRAELKVRRLSIAPLPEREASGSPSPDVPSEQDE